MPGNRKPTRSQKRIRAAIDASSSSSSEDEGYGSHLDDGHSDDDESFREDGDEMHEDDEVIPIDDTSDEDSLLASQDMHSPAKPRRRQATPGPAAARRDAANMDSTPADRHPAADDAGSAETTILSGLSTTKKSSSVDGPGGADAQMAALVGTGPLQSPIVAAAAAAPYASPAARCSKKARLLSKSAMATAANDDYDDKDDTSGKQTHGDSLTTIGLRAVAAVASTNKMTMDSTALADIQSATKVDADTVADMGDELEQAAARLGSKVMEVVCVGSTSASTNTAGTIEHTAKATSNDMPMGGKSTKNTAKEKKAGKKSKLKMKKSTSGASSKGVPVSEVASIMGGGKKKTKKDKAKKAEEETSTAATTSIEKENTGNDGKPTTSTTTSKAKAAAKSNASINLADTDDDDDDDFAPSAGRAKKTKAKTKAKANGKKTAAASTAKSTVSPGSRKSSRARKSVVTLSEDQALAQAIAASLAESLSQSQSQPEPEKEEDKEEEAKEDTNEPTVKETEKPKAKTKAKSAAKGKKDGKARSAPKEMEDAKAEPEAPTSSATIASTDTNGDNPEKKSEPKLESTAGEQPAKPAGIKRKKKKKKKVSALADGEAKAAATTTTSDNPAKAAESSDAPAKKTSKKDASSNASDTSDKKRSATASASSAKPPPKKKKRTFQDMVYLTMLNSCKPYTLKTLGQATNSTEQQLNYVMLSLVDKNLVQKKEFPAGNSGRTKTLYWANQDATSKDVGNTDATEEERMVTANELGGMQQQLRSIHTELQSVLATPTNAELDAQVHAAEAELAALRKQATEMKERIAAAAGSGSSTNPTKVKKSINSMREVWRKRKLSCMDFVDNMADAMEKSRKDAMKLLDIETDEAYGAKLPPKYDV